MAEKIRVAPSAPVVADGSNVPYQRVITAMNHPVGPEPANMVCPSCSHGIRTTVEYKSKSSAHITACLMCLFCCWCCFCIPYCMDAFKTMNHYCPNCKAFIGSYSR